jgi:hypothetical protein
MDAEQRLSQKRGVRIQWRHAKKRGKRPVTDTGSQPQSQSTSSPPASSQSEFSVARRWTVIASGLLLLALALVVIYTGPSAFFSPVALVVVSAIGLAALLLQVRFRRDLPNVHPPLWLNVLGIVFALMSLFADYLRMTRRMLELVAFTAVVCFGISGSLILRSLRRAVRTRRATAAE